LGANLADLRRSNSWDCGSGEIAVGLVGLLAHGYHDMVWSLTSRTTYGPETHGI
jgi:hypothetical protein